MNWLKQRKKTRKIFEALEKEVDRQVCGKKRIRIKGAKR